MVASSRGAALKQVGIGPAILIAYLLNVTCAHTQDQRDIDQCAGKEGATLEIRIHSCTALIQSNAYTGKELALAFNNRGFAYFHKGDFESAMASLNEAIRLDTKSVSAYNNRALVHMARGELDLAIADYSEAIRVDPAHAFSVRSRGAAYYSKHDYRRAIADYTEAIKLDPANGIAYSGRGNAYYEEKDYERAIADYTQGLKVTPAEPRTLEGPSARLLLPATI